jgi:hypothetical protein
MWDAAPEPHYKAPGLVMKENYAQDRNSRERDASKDFQEFVDDAKEAYYPDPTME